MLNKSLLFVLLMVLTTPWAVAQKALRYKYGFENNDLAGEGWTRINNYSNNSSIIPAVYHNGSYGYKFGTPSNNSAPQYLISPRLVMPANVSNIKVSLYYMTAANNNSPTGYQEKFKVGFTTDNNPNSFTTWDTEVSTNTKTWQYFETSITIPVTTKYIAIANYDFIDGLYIDDIDFNCDIIGPSFIAKDGAIPFITDYSYSFGLTFEGTSHTFTFSNPGTQSSSISVTHTGDFGVSLQNSTIPAGGSTTLTVTMPETSGNDVITISSTNGVFNSFVINVSGTVRDEDKLYQNGFSSCPTGWTTTGNWKYENNAAYPYRNYFSSGGSNGQLITPRVYIAEGEKFYVEAKGKSSSNTLKLQYSANGSSWTEIATFSSIDQSNWKIFEFTGAPAGGYYIAIYSDYAYIRMYYGGRLFDKTFQDDGNWNDGWSGGVPKSSDYVFIDAACTIPADCIAQANNITLGTNGSITIEDGGQLVCNNAVQATMQKHITGYNAGGSDWYFIASPVADGTTPSTENGILNAYPDNYDLFYYDQHTNRWINYKDDGDANTPNADPGFVSDGGKLLNGKGYLYANSDNIDLLFQGVLSNNGTVSLVYDEHAAPEAEGWNLVGNPFPCNAIADKAFYIINGNIANASTGATVISPCTGVMVQATDSDQNVTFTKAADQTPDLASADNGNIQITLAHTVASRGGASTNSATIDNAIISFNEGSRLEKFYFGSPAANIYIPQNHEEYAIVSAEKQGEMPINFVANENGEYTITVNPENVQLNYLHLIDNMTGADIDLFVAPSYTFNARTTDYASRFLLVFSVNDMNDNDNENFAFISNGQLIVNGTGTIQIIDIMGRVIVTKSTEEHINTNGMTSGVYVLQLITGTETKTQKMVVR